MGSKHSPQQKSWDRTHQDVLLLCCFGGVLGCVFLCVCVLGLGVVFLFCFVFSEEQKRGGNFLSSLDLTSYLSQF